MSNITEAEPSDEMDLVVRELSELSKKHNLSFCVFLCKEMDKTTHQALVNWDATEDQMRGMLLCALQEEPFTQLVLSCLKEKFLDIIREQVAAVESKDKTKH